VSAKSLSWSHYLFLIGIDNTAARSFYEIEAQKQRWSLREMRRQFNTALYERLALSTDKAGVAALAQHGQIIETPHDLVKDPYILEFLGIDEQTRYSESELEQAIIDKIEHFMLELGSGFLFYGRQKRITFDDKHFRIDLVFYHRLLRCFVLIDLKIGELQHQDIGQMQMYVNYYDREVRMADENPTVGIILCKHKNKSVVEFTLPLDNQQIFASKYLTYLPDKAVLQAQLAEIVM
jgi:predicted nuclease of restriction endonuclease-like (RecB) superfamily